MILRERHVKSRDLPASRAPLPPPGFRGTQEAMCPASDPAPPQLTVLEAQELLLRYWGLRLPARELGAERDQNFLFEDRETAFILKITNPAERRATSAAQTQALLHLETHAPDLPVPRLVRDRAQSAAPLAHLPDGRQAVLRLITVLPGMPVDPARLHPATGADLGRMAARLAQGLASLPVPPAPPDLLWSFARLPDLRPLSTALEPDLQARIAPILDDLCGPVLSRYHALPVQLVHNDLNPSNVFVTGTGTEARITGIIDFGDMLGAPRLGDLAVLLTYLVGEGAQALDLPCAVARAYHAQAPLSADEWDLLPGLMLARAVMSILIATARARDYPENADYLLRNRAPVLRVLDLLADPDAAATAQIKGAAE